MQLTDALQDAKSVTGTQRLGGRLLRRASCARVSHNGSETRGLSPSNGIDASDRSHWTWGVGDQRRRRSGGMMFTAGRQKYQYISAKKATTDRGRRSTPADDKRPWHGQTNEQQVRWCSQRTRETRRRRDAAGLLDKHGVQLTRGYWQADIKGAGFADMLYRPR